MNGSTRGGVSSYIFSRYYYGVPGKTYRVKVTFICIIDGDGETQPHTSGRIMAN